MMDAVAVRTSESTSSLVDVPAADESDRAARRARTGDVVATTSDKPRRYVRCTTGGSPRDDYVRTMTLLVSLVAITGRAAFSRLRIMPVLFRRVFDPADARALRAVVENLADDDDTRD